MKSSFKTAMHISMTSTIFRKGTYRTPKTAAYGEEKHIVKTDKQQK